MPWTSKTVPSNIKNLSPKRKRQWTKVANSAMKRGKSDGDAVHMANGVVSRQLGRSTARKDLDDDRELLEILLDAFDSYDEDDEEDLDDLLPSSGEKSRSFIDRLAVWIGLKSPEPEVGDLPAFQLKELPDGRLRYLCISSNNYKDFTGEYFPAAAHKEAIQWTEANNAYPELWPWHCYGERLGVADWIDFDGNFLLSSGLIDVGMETKARAWAEDPDTRMSHGFFKRQIGPDIVQYRQFEQSVLPMWAAANPFTDFTVGAKEMALTPEKKAALAEKGYSPEDIAGLEAKTDDFRQRLAAMGVSMKDIDDDTKVPEPDPDPAPSPEPAPGAGPSFSLDDLRAVIREEVGAATKELSVKVEQIEAGTKQSDDEKFSRLWAEKQANARPPASKSSETTVGQKEAVAAGKSDAWVGNIPLFQWLDQNGMNGQGVNGQGG